MGGDVEKSANSAFTAGSKRHTATDDYEMQDGNDKVAAASKKRGEEGVGAGAGAGVRGGPELGGSGDTSPGIEDEQEPAGPTARMVDPRAAESNIKSREEAAERRTGVAVGGNDADRETGSAGGVQPGGGTGVRRREEEAAAGDAAKRARLGAEGEGGMSNGASSGVEVADGGGGGGVREVEDQQEERTAEEQRAEEEREKAQRSAAAKAKKEAAVKAARERFLARKKAS